LLRSPAKSVERVDVHLDCVGDGESDVWVEVDHSLACEGAACAHYLFKGKPCLVGDALGVRPSTPVGLRVIAVDEEDELLGTAEALCVEDHLHVLDAHGVTSERWNVSVARE